MRHLATLLIRFYRACISPLKPPSCRFYPTCSAYALEAFRKRHFFPALILTVTRLFRCQPFSKGGYDPVPAHGFRRIPFEKSVTACKFSRAGIQPQRKNGL